MRIGLVNDMAMVIRVLEQAVNSIDECEVAWVARNGKEAITMCRNDRPDLVLMDLIMPEMNGVESTREIMKSAPCPILIVTSSVTENASMVFEAMGAGALDAISTPILMPGGAIKDAAAGLQGKISTVKRLIKAEAKHKKHKEMKVVRPEKSDQWLCVIGASTGGPHALSEILRHLPKEIGAAGVLGICGRCVGRQ